VIMNRICANCKLVNFAGVEVCKRCGTALGSRPPAPLTNPAPAAQPASNHLPASAPLSSYLQPDRFSQEGIIEQHIKRTSRNLLVINLLIMAVAAGAAILKVKEIHHFIKGPTRLNYNALFRIERAD